MLLEKQKLEEMYTSLRKPTPPLPEEVLVYVITIHRVCQISTFTSMMLERNMGRILACLLLICENSACQQTAEKAMRQLEEMKAVKNKLVLVKGLRSLLRGSKGIRKRVIAILTELLVEEGGLDAVLQAQLEGVDEGNADALAGVAKLITSVPAAVDKVMWVSSIYFTLLSIYSYF